MQSISSASDMGSSRLLVGTWGCFMTCLGMLIYSSLSILVSRAFGTVFEFFPNTAYCHAVLVMHHAGYATVEDARLSDGVATIFSWVTLHI